MGSIYFKIYKTIKIFKNSSCFSFVRGVYLGCVHFT